MPLNTKDIAKRFFTLYPVKSQKELARELGISTSAITEWKKGRSAVPWERLIQAVEEKDASWDWLLTGKSKSATQKKDAKQGKRIRDYFHKRFPKKNDLEISEHIGITLAKLNEMFSGAELAASDLHLLWQAGCDLNWVITGTKNETIIRWREEGESETGDDEKGSEPAFVDETQRKSSDGFEVKEDDVNAPPAETDGDEVTRDTLLAMCFDVQENLGRFGRHLLAGRSADGFDGFEALSDSLEELERQLSDLMRDRTERRRSGSA